MATSFVNLDTTQYVRINVAYTSMILQAHRDAVRITVSDTKPAKSNEAFHLVGGADAPLPLDIVNTNVWALAASEKSSLIVTESTTSFATEETVSQLVMAVTNAIDETTYDLNAAAFSAVTNISNDYELDNVEFNFSTVEAKTITITSADGTIILNEPSNTDTSFIWQPSSEMGFNGGENLTVDVTQFSSPGTMDCILKIKSGTNTLIGDPHTGWIDNSGTKRGYQLAGSGRPRISIVPYEHEISAGNLDGHVHLWGFGERSGVQIDTRGEDIWYGVSPRIPFPNDTVGEQMTIVSSDAQDATGETGAGTVKIDYIDSTGDAQTEEIIMNGINPVNTNATDITFVNHMYVTTIGSNGVVVGNIDIHKVGDSATVYNRIMAGNNKSLTCAIRVPNGVNFFIEEWHCSVAGNKPTAVRLRSTDWDSTLYDGSDPVFLFKDSAFLAEGNFDRHFKPPIKVPCCTTIKISAWATQDGAYISASFNGFYE